MLWHTLAVNSVSLLQWEAFLWYNVKFYRHWFICQFFKALMCSIYLKSWLYTFINPTVFRDRYLGHFTAGYKIFKTS